MVDKATLDVLVKNMPRDPLEFSHFLPGLVRLAFGDDFPLYHTLRVASWAAWLNKHLDLGIEPHLIDIAAWLHDIGQIEGHKGHAKRGRVWVEEWLKGILDEEDLNMVLDGIENHGTSATPGTDLGHILRFSDALGVWDPVVIGWARINASCEEIKRFAEAQMSKKMYVIEEYWNRWPDTVDLTRKSIEVTRLLLECEGEE